MTNRSNRDWRDILERDRALLGLLLGGVVGFLFVKGVLGHFYVSGPQISDRVFGSFLPDEPPFVLEAIVFLVTAVPVYLRIMGRLKQVTCYLTGVAVAIMMTLSGGLH